MRTHRYGRHDRFDFGGGRDGDAQTRASRYRYQTALDQMSGGAATAIRRAIVDVPAAKLSALNEALESVFVTYVQKMQALTDLHGGAYAGIGVRTGQPYRDRADALEREFEQAMVAETRKFLS